MHNHQPSTTHNTLIHALWIGDKLGEISRCCLTSFIKQGHSVYLHTYGDIQDLPQGITICDANKIIKKEKIFRHKHTGSYAIFADIFRYELLKNVNGIYVDCDVYCLKPLTIPEHGYLFGLEDDNIINNAILALPSNSSLLNRLSNIITHKNFIPEWYSDKAKKRLKLRNIFGLSKHISEMKWGVTGPEALTYYVNACKVEHLAQAIDIFYPIHYDRISQLLSPDLSLNEVVTSKTLAVHLYNEKLRQVNLSTLHPNSILAKMLNHEV